MEKGMKQLAGEYLSNKETNLENNKNHELGSFEQDPIRRDAIYYLEKGESALIKRKNKLNKQITKAFKENKIYTEQARMDFKELHKINQHLFVKKELESTFGFDIVDFYTKYLKYGMDPNRRVDIKETMQDIEDSMKQEKNDEQTIQVMLTNRDKKELRKLYDKIDHLYTTGKYSEIFSLTDTMNQKLNDYIEAGCLEHFKNYDFYNVDSSNTLTKLGLNKWDIKAFLTDSNKAEMNQGETETLEQEFSGKSMQELRKFKKELNSKITKDAKKGHTDTETFKENLMQLVDVRYNIKIKSWIDDRIEIFNVDKFCQKYSSRLGIDPKQQISMFYEDIAKDRRRLSIDDEVDLMSKKWDTVSLIQDMYQSLQDLEKNKDWSGVNEQTRAIMTELGNLFRAEGQLQLSHYYDVSDSHTLKKLNISIIDSDTSSMDSFDLRAKGISDQHDKPELKKLNITDVPQHFVEKDEPMLDGPVKDRSSRSLNEFNTFGSNKETEDDSREKEIRINRKIQSFVDLLNTEGIAPKIDATKIESGIGSFYAVGKKLLTEDMWKLTNRIVDTTKGLAGEINEQAVQMMEERGISTPAKKLFSDTHTICEASFQAANQTDMTYIPRSGLKAKEDLDYAVSELKRTSPAVLAVLKSFSDDLTKMIDNALEDIKDLSGDELKFIEDLELNLAKIDLDIFKIERVNKLAEGFINDFTALFEQAKANKRIDGEKVPQETQQQQMNIEAKEQQESTAQVSFKNKKLESASLTFAEMLTKKAEEIRHRSRRKTSQKIQQQKMNTEVIYAEVKKESKSKNADVSISLKAEEKLVDRLNKGKKERPEVPPKPMSKQRNLKELVLTQSPTQPSTLEFGEAEKLSIKDKIKLFEQKAVANRESRNSTTQELSR
jgi:hypothetical protein